MPDIFIEHMVAQRITPASIALRVLYAMAYLFLCTAIFFFLPSILVFVMGCGLWLLFVLYRQLNIEFEYILTNGEMDIDRITGKSKRKRLLTVDCRTFEACAPMDSQHFSQYENMQFGKRLDVSSGIQNANRWFIVTSSKEGGRLLLIFEPDDRILAAIRTYNRRVSS